jgi:hypothetical protein
MSHDNVTHCNMSSHAQFREIHFYSFLNRLSQLHAPMGAFPTDLSIFFPNFLPDRFFLVHCTEYHHGTVGHEAKPNRYNKKYINLNHFVDCMPRIKHGLFNCAYIFSSDTVQCACYQRNAVGGGGSVVLDFLDCPLLMLFSLTEIKFLFSGNDSELPQ